MSKALMPEPQGYEKLKLQFNLTHKHRFSVQPKPKFIKQSPSKQTKNST